MDRYTYRFRWRDKQGILRTGFLEGSSMINAMDSFEEEYDMKCDDKIEVRRVHV